MLTWAYFAALLTDPGGVPVGWHPFSDDATAARELELLQYSGGSFYAVDRKDPRRPRFCKHCKSWKPERAHHCSVSGRCILKMVRGAQGHVCKRGSACGLQQCCCACEGAQRVHRRWPDAPCVPPVSLPWSMLVKSPPRRTTTASG
jgi:hypothetical protein